MSGRYAAETKEGFQPMTDTTTADAVLSNDQVSRIYARAIVTNTNTSWDDTHSLVTSHRALQTRLDQAHWDAISRDQTIENLRAENARYREALEFYAAHGGERARAALGEGVTP